MYVMHLLAPAEVGGLERVVGTLSAAQGRAGMRVMVATVGGGVRAVQSASKGEGLGEVKFVSIPVERRGYLSERQAVERLLRTRRPDILHTHGYRPDVLDSPVARGVGIPTVTTVHGFTGGGLKNRLYEWLQKRSFRTLHLAIDAGVDSPTLLMGCAMGNASRANGPNGTSSSSLTAGRRGARRS